MSKVQLGLLVGLLLLGLLVAGLALRNPQPPMLPPDEDHARFSGPDACDECHGPRAVYPRSRNHPLGRDCLRCHGRS